MQPVKRMLLPLLVLALAAIACNSAGRAATETPGSTEPVRMVPALTDSAPIATAPVDGMSAPASTEVPMETPTAMPKAVVEASALNLRDGPGLTYQVLAILPNGEELTVMGEHNGCDWLEVQRMTGDTGWVKAGPGFANFSGSCAAVQNGAFRPLNGTIVFDRRDQQGPGTLTVVNSTATDGLVALASTGGQPVVGFYLRSMERYTLTGCADGSYYLYYQNGQGWDGSANRFKQVESIKRVDQPIEFVTTAEGYTTWTLTLANGGTGSAKASDISQDAFPVLR